MVSTSTIVALGVATLIMVGLIITGVLVNRKTAHFSRNLVVGLLTYFLGQILFVASNQMLSGFNNGYIYLLARGITFVAAAYLVILAFKRFRQNPKPDAISLTFGYTIFTVFQSLVAFVSYFMVSFAVNKGEVDKAYPDLSPDKVAEIIKQVTDLNGMDVVLRVLLVGGIIVSAVIAFKYISRYIYDAKPNKRDLAFATLAVVLTDMVPEFVSMISNKNVVIVSLSCLVVSVGLIVSVMKFDHETSH